MSLMTLEQAAQFCCYTNKESFRKAVHHFNLPAIKLGKNLLFDKEDLLNHLKSHHNMGAIDGDKRKKDVKCHLSKEVTHGISTSTHQTEREYDNLLKLPISS